MVRAMTSAFNPSPVLPHLYHLCLMLITGYDHAQLWVLSGYSGRIAALQLNSGSSQLLRSRSRRYASVKYDPWSILHSLFTTPHRLPCLFVSSPHSRYILRLVSFSPDLVYFTRT